MVARQQPYKIAVNVAVAVAMGIVLVDSMLPSTQTLLLVLTLANLA